METTIQQPVKSTEENWEAYQEANRKRCCCCGTCSCCGKFCSIFFTLYMIVAAGLYFSGALSKGITIYEEGDVDEDSSYYSQFNLYQDYGVNPTDADTMKAMIIVNGLIAISCFIIGGIGLFMHRSCLVLAPVIYWILNDIAVIIICVVSFIEFNDRGILDKMGPVGIIIYICLVAYAISWSLPFIMIYHTNYKLIKMYLGR
eukprot:311664_1